MLTYLQQMIQVQRKENDGMVRADRKIITENRNKYKPFHITYKEVMQLKHIFILRLIRKEDGSLISERDMDTMAGKDKEEAVNELNGNSVGYLGYQK